MNTTRQVSVCPTTDADVDDVARFLTAELNPRVSVSQWASAMMASWQRDPPNHGYHLRVDGGVVGAYVALYTERRLGPTTYRFCNLAAWCVNERYRAHSIRLVMALLDQDGYHFTDFSPSGNVVMLNERLGFQHLDTTTFLAPNLPWPTRPGRVKVVTRPSQIESILRDDELEVFRDHTAAPAARHLVLVDRDEHCYVMFRPDRRRNLPMFATVLFVSNRQVFAKHWRRLGRHMLLRHFLPFSLVELRVTGSRPGVSWKVPRARPKMFRSPSLPAEQIDYLYSELTELAW